MIRASQGIPKTRPSSQKTSVTFFYQWLPWFASYQGNIFSYPDGQLSSRIKLISNSYSRFLKNGGMPGCPGQGLAEEGRARLARSILTIICTFLGKPPVRPRRAGNLSRSRSFDAAHVLATVTIPLLPSAGRECYNVLYNPLASDCTMAEWRTPPRRIPV